MFAPTNLFAQQKQDTTKKIEAYINGMEEKEAASICQKFYGKRSIPKNKEEFLQKVQDLTNPFMLRHEDAIMKGCRPPSITHSWVVTKKNLDKAEKCLMLMKPDSVKAEDLRKVLKQTRSQYLEMDETHENKAAWKLKKKDIQTSCSPFLDSTDVFRECNKAVCVNNGEKLVCAESDDNKNDEENECVPGANYRLHKPSILSQENAVHYHALMRSLNAVNNALKRMKSTVVSKLREKGTSSKTIKRIAALDGSLLTTHKTKVEGRQTYDENEKNQARKKKQVQRNQDRLLKTIAPEGEVLEKYSNLFTKGKPFASAVQQKMRNAVKLVPGKLRRRLTFSGAEIGHKNTNVAHGLVGAYNRNEQRMDDEIRLTQKAINQLKSSRPNLTNTNLPLKVRTTGSNGRLRVAAGGDRLNRARMKLWGVRETKCVNETCGKEAYKNNSTSKKQKLVFTEQTKRIVGEKAFAKINKPFERHQLDAKIDDVMKMKLNEFATRVSAKEKSIPVSKAFASDKRMLTKLTKTGIKPMVKGYYFQQIRFTLRRDKIKKETVFLLEKDDTQEVDNTSASNSMNNLRDSPLNLFYFVDGAKKPLSYDEAVFALRNKIRKSKTKNAANTEFYFQSEQQRRPSINAMLSLVNGPEATSKQKAAAKTQKKATKTQKKATKTPKTTKSVSSRSQSSSKSTSPTLSASNSNNDPQRPQNK